MNYKNRPGQTLGGTEGHSMTTTHTYAVRPISAFRGSLDGFEVVCSCGDRQTTSLSALEANRLGWDHADYFARMAAKSGRKVAA